MDWEKAKKHFDRRLKELVDSIGVDGSNVEVAIITVYFPIANRYNSGERSERLYASMVGL